MTSKEIIEKRMKLLLHDLLAEDNSYYYELQIKEYKQVLKDLKRLEKQDKILEILSNHLFGIDGTISIEINDCDNKEEYNLIKEWLDGKD